MVLSDVWGYNIGMTILLAILSGLKVAFTMVVGVLTKIPAIVWLCIACVLLGGWLIHGGSCRSIANRS